MSERKSQQLEIPLLQAYRLLELVEPEGRPKLRILEMKTAAGVSSCLVSGEDLAMMAQLFARHARTMLPPSA